MLERALYPARGRERVRALIGGREGAAVLARRPAQGRLQCRFGVRPGPRSLRPGERPGARGEGKDEERERRPDLQAGAQPCGDWPFLACPGGVLACPGGVLACPGGVFDVSGAATAGLVVVVVVGWLFPWPPAHGGFPFCVRVLCFLAAASHVLTFGELHRPLFVALVGGGTVGVVTGVVTGWVTGVGTVCVGGGDGGRCGEVGRAAGREPLGGAVTKAIAVGVGRGICSCVFA